VIDPETEEVTGCWRNKLHNLYFLPNILSIYYTILEEYRRDEKYTINFGRKIGREETTWKL
jgi:hypothetical protein